jgi:glycosyltransferase involved in cell wall biosynthesis
MASPGSVRDGLAQAAKSLAGCRYLLVMPVAWYEAPDKSIWIDALWHRDLMRHLDYLDQLTVLAPRLPYTGQAGLVQVDRLAPVLRFVALPWGANLASAVLRAPAAFAATRRAVRDADIVHSGIAGWPLPPGLFANSLAVWLGRPLVIVVESAFWRLAGSGPHRVKDRIRARLTEALARWSIRRSALSVFTHQGYLDSLGDGVTTRAIVTPASWIDADDVLDRAAAIAAWADKPLPVRFLFAGRLVEEKGLLVLLDALRMADAAAVPSVVDVIGEGALRAEVASTAKALRYVQLRLLDPVPYGASFLSLLRSRHAVLVPSITDEQPRILYDAASQAVPVLASDTDGHRTAVEDGVTGWRYAPGSAQALFAAMRRATEDPQALQTMGLAARDMAEGQTHQAMHLARANRLAAIYRTSGSSGS